ncbi:dihydropyrimidine dehydrogenase, partial [Pseudomonas aeruginosa]|nr:dihydropyrimidine dehydrogenase [Pseudomonas aeruginosa]
LRHDQRIGDNLALRARHDEYYAVFLALGLAASKSLCLEDEDVCGLLAATDYIRELRQSDDLLDLPVADRCIVIGAGNTAIDMTVQMRLLGVRDVNLVYRRHFDTMSDTG